MFARAVDLIFVPVPTPDLLRQFSDDIMALRASTFGSTPCAVSLWALAENNDRMTEVLEHRAMMADERQAFVAHVKDAVEELRHKPEYHSNPLIRWLLLSMAIACGRDRTGFLGPGEWEMIRDGADEKRVLKWTSVGQVLGTLVEMGVYNEQDLYPKRFHLPMFMNLATVTVPQFGAKLFELQGVMQAQSLQCREIKAKLLATAVTFALTGGQLLVKYLDS
eukprot:NODE_3189_length_817_cov_330.589239.p1 GENE.NODE_3189_length_817_cov_330.589239~~NODE_3189_length_817_cov_330.589239.p1  ORF type:complete len:231 (-),score=37.92 NODE_3189_length_817_cov_330.589239:108-770(-)